MTCVLYSILSYILRCVLYSILRLRHASVRLSTSHTVLISSMTADFLDTGFPPLLSFEVSAQSKSPQITIVSCANSSSCWFSLLKKATCWATSLGA